MPAITMLDYASQIQDPMRVGLIQNIVASSVFFSLLRFVPVDGFNYPYGEQATLGGIAFRGINESYTASAGIVNPKIETLKIFGGLIQIDHQFAGSEMHANAVMAKTRAAGLHYDYHVINGDQSSDAKQFVGLKHRLQGNQVILPTSGVGEKVELEDIDNLVDRVVGPNESKVLLMSKYQRRRVKEEMRIRSTATSMEDISTMPATFNGVRIVVLDEDDTETPILPQTETCGTAHNTGSIYCIRPGSDPAGEYVQGLVRGQMVEHKPLAQVNTTVSDLVEIVAGLGVFHGRAAARLMGLG